MIARALPLGLGLGLALSAGGAVAMDFALPGQAALVAEDRREGATVMLPVAAWSSDGVETLDQDGGQVRRVWRMRGTDATVLQVMDAVAAQIEEAGFTPVFQCHDVACGGFDFRFSLDLIGEPEMHVDLRDFRYLVARSEDALVSAVVSRNGVDAFLHLTEVTDDPDAAPLAVTTRGGAPEVIGAVTTAGTPFAEGLVAKGHAPLPDLVFAAGSSTLGQESFPSLAALAGFLADNPQARIMLVGHTDADGALAGNIALSKRRASSVRERLISAHGADGSRIAAEGVGFLAPIATNETDTGREANRRVEVVLDR